MRRMAASLPLGGWGRSITGIVIMLGGTAVFAKSRIQRTTALSSTESETMAGSEAGKHIKYFRKLFLDLRFPLTCDNLPIMTRGGQIETE
jgi:hypothetical protein